MNVQSPVSEAVEFTKFVANAANLQSDEVEYAFKMHYRLSVMLDLLQGLLLIRRVSGAGMI